MKQKIKNSIKTPSYFIKRLRDSGFIVWKVFNAYSEADPRRWTVLVDPSGASVFITCFTNKEFYGEVMFEMNDGGRRFPKNFSLKTESLEVIITHLLEAGIDNNPKTNRFYKEAVSKYNHGEQWEQQKEKEQ